MRAAQEDPMDIRTRALSFMERGEQLYQNPTAPDDKAKGYLIYKKGLEFMINYARGKSLLPARFLYRLLS